MKTGVEMARKSVNKTGINFEKNDVLRGKSRDKKFNADEQRDKQTDRQTGRQAVIQMKRCAGQ